MTKLSFDIGPDTLESLVRRILREALTVMETDRERLGGQLAYGEAEAARLLSLAPHQLRDERRRGRISASIGPGRRILYTKVDLLKYLSSRRWSIDAGAA